MGGGVTQSQVLSQVSGPKGMPRSELGLPPLVRTGVGNPRDRLRCAWYISYGFPQEDFLVDYKISCLPVNVP